MGSSATSESGRAGINAWTSALLRAARLEVRAIARLASLIASDREDLVPAIVPPQADVVVLVHGFMATAGVMRPLRMRLEAEQDVVTASFTYAPALGVAAVARLLEAIVRRMPDSVRLHLVGHSLGGLAVRWYVQETRSDPRVVQTISIAAPFEGARGARWLPGAAGRDIRSGSAVLQRLHQGAMAAPALPHLTILGTADTAISNRTRFAVGDRVVVAGCGHNGLLFDPQVADAVVARVVAPRSKASQSAG